MHIWQTINVRKIVSQYPTKINNADSVNHPNYNWLFTPVLVSVYNVWLMPSIHHCLCLKLTSSLTLDYSCLSNISIRTESSKLMLNLFFYMNSFLNIALLSAAGTVRYPLPHIKALYHIWLQLCQIHILYGRVIDGKPSHKLLLRLPTRLSIHYSCLWTFTGPCSKAYQCLSTSQVSMLCICAF